MTSKEQQAMTTARDVILRNFNAQQVASFNAILDFLVTHGPESVRLELAALLNPWLPMKDELETLANDCQECAEGCEAESKYGDRRAWQSVAYRIRHALRHLPALPSEDK